MSAFNKLAEFEEEVKKAEAEFKEVYVPAEPAKEDEPPKENPVGENPTPPEPVVEDWEKKYRDSLKGMNEAQRKAADTLKAKEDAEKRATELEAKLNETLERARLVQETAKPQAVVEEDDLESDMPEVAKIARKYASRAQKELENRLDEISKRLKAEEENRKRLEGDRSARQMVSEIKAIHPDYDQLVNSDEMINWVNNEAPPIYKAIFDGAIPFHAKDAITVLNAYKSHATPKPQAPAVPSAAEVAAPVNTNTPISTRLKTEAPITQKEADWFMYNSHKLTSEQLADWDKRLNG